MMQKYLFTILFALTATYVFSQRDYFEYHEIINEAEYQIVEEEFEKALQLYDSAFSIFEFVFTKDYIIAAQLAALQEEKIICLDYMESAMKNGYKLYCLRNLKVLTSFLKTEDWKLLSDQSAAYRELYIDRVDQDLMFEWITRYLRDQKYKNSEYAREVFEDNYARLVELLDTFPFVSTQIIGIDDNNLVPADLRENGISKLSDCNCENSKVMVTLKHIGNPFKEISLDNYIEAIRKGHLHPREFAIIYAYTDPKYIDNPFGREPKVKGPLIKEIKLNYFFENRYEDLDAVNNDRKSFGLPSISTDQKKLAIENKYGIRLHFWYLKLPIENTDN